MSNKKLTFDEMVSKEEGNVVSQVSEGLNKVLQTFKNKRYEILR